MRGVDKEARPITLGRPLSVRRATMLAMVSVAGRVPGFLIPVLVAAVFGAAGQTDAYFIVYNAVLLVGGTLGQAVDVSIVPFAARRLLMVGGEPGSFLARTSWRVVLVAAAAWLVIVPLLLLASTGFGRAVTVYGLAFMLLVLCWSWASVYSGALVAEGRIAHATASLGWRGLGGLLGLALAPSGGGLWAVAIGLGVGELARVVWLRHTLFSNREHVAAGREFTPTGSFGHALVMMVASGAAVSAVPVLEKILALPLGSGAASHLEYATRLLVIPAVLFDGAIAPHFLSAWSQLRATDGRPPTRREVAVALATALIVAGPLAVILAVFAPEIVGLLLHHGRFTQSDATSVVALLRILALGFTGSMGALVAERAYLATQRNALLAALSTTRAVVRLITIGILLNSIGILAFPTAYAAGEWAYLFLLWSFLPRQVEPLRALN